MLLEYRAYLCLKQTSTNAMSFVTVFNNIAPADIKSLKAFMLRDTPHGYIAFKQNQMLEIVCCQPQNFIYF